MNNYSSEIIYKDKNQLGARTIWVSLANEKLYITGQDSGPGLEKFFGKDCYERFITDVPVKDVKRCLNVETDSQLIKAIKCIFGKNSGIDDFRAFCEINMIHYKYGSY